MAKREIPRPLKRLYFPPAEGPEFVNVPSMQYLMIDGHGYPGSSREFQEAIEALYGVAYTLRFGSEDPRIREAPLMPLEGRFRGESRGPFPVNDPKRWHWTLMLRVPSAVSRKLFVAAVERLRERKNPPALDSVRLERWREGKAAQVLYVGPYAKETPTIAALHEFITTHGFRVAGDHHEIYLGDPRKTRPEKLKTVIRQPARG